MAFVKFNTRTLDKATGVIHEPSNDFVEVSETFAQRIKELMKDARHKGSFEFKAFDFKADKEFIKENKLEGVVEEGEVVTVTEESIEINQQINGDILAKETRKPRKKRYD